MKYFALIGLFLFGCSSDTVVSPTSSPSPSPSPESVLTHMIVKQTVSQGGHPITEAGVESNKDFKIAGMAQCFDGEDKQITCQLIPYWSHQQTAGFGANCTQFGSESDNYTIYNCTQPMRDAQFETCALDWDRHELGCDRVNLNIG